MNRIVSREYLTLGINFDSCLDFLSRIIHKNQKKKCNINNQKCTISFLAASSHHALNYTLDIFFFKRMTITQYFVNLKKRELSHQFTQDSVQPNMPITMLILRIYLEAKYMIVYIRFYFCFQEHLMRLIDISHYSCIQLTLYLKNKFIQF